MRDLSKLGSSSSSTTLYEFDRPYHGETTWQKRADEMTIVEHSVEFRKRLIAVVLCYIIVFIVAFVFEENSTKYYRWRTKT